MIRPPRLILFLAASVCLGQSTFANSDWQIIKLGNREFLSAENIGTFYGLFSVADPIAKTAHLVNGTNEVEMKLGSREIMINGARNWLSFPVVEKDGQLLISRVDLAKTLEPQLRPQMIPNLGKVQTVVIDPGHGGYDRGAICNSGYEKNFALDVARQLRPI